MVDYRSENFDLNVFLVTSNVCLDPGLVVMKILNIIDIFCGGVTEVVSEHDLRITKNIMFFLRFIDYHLEIDQRKCSFDVLGSEDDEIIWFSCCIYY